MFGKSKSQTDIFADSEPDSVQALKEQIGLLLISNEQCAVRNEKATKDLTKAINSLNTTLQRAGRSRKW